MPRPTSKQPTELELEIIKILWRDGPSTVRHVREQLEPFRELAHNSVMTVMGIMTDKGYLRRRLQSNGNGYLYTARIRRNATVRGMLSDLVDRAFSGSTMDAILQLLDTSDLDAEELAQLRSEVDRKAKERDS
ncbi:BlaI/MecI/CopY family transcriptional regulator [Gimesia aquarii]|uniref:Penicillinase repressor n=1 Tax=Gimesia aquarii TaxID=2527964 RepID=A0A517W4M4_9PLAN|nr:BlaI/MecI/CopY family transcriptional regulator [Gimesia aquarii]QDU00194.1 Penicillinase repressor [Gimesia aquarii]